jgi:hypothetical protein
MAIEERVARLEGITEQIDRRLSNMERGLEALVANKADKWETRLWFTTMLTLLAALLGIVIAKL